MELQKLVIDENESIYLDGVEILNVKNYTLKGSAEGLTELTLTVDVEINQNHLIENKMEKVKIDEKTFNELTDRYITPTTDFLGMRINHSNNEISYLTKRVEKIESSLKLVYKIFILFATVYVLTFVLIALLQLFC